MIDKPQGEDAIVSEAGFDSVYKAERQQPVRRQVALQGARKVSGDEHPKTRQTMGYLADLYESWPVAEPGKGCDAKAAARRRDAA